MPRVKRAVAAQKKRRKVLEEAKGYWGLKSTNYKYAKEQVERSLAYAYRDRKVKKRKFRQLWNMRINAGAFPFWLAPVQIRVIPVGEAHRAAAHDLADRLEYRVEVDLRDETVGKRIRDSEVEKIPVTIVYGDKESDESLAVREHGGEQSTKSLAEFRQALAKLSPWQAGA